MATNESANTSYNRILVTVDGTDEQDKVLARSIAIAAKESAELYIGHVIDISSLDSTETHPPEMEATLEKSFRDSIACYVAQAEADPNIPKVEVIVRSGRIRETLQDDMIDVIHPNLVICGARGLSSIKYAVLGSISTFLVRNTECDTLVIK